MSRLAACVSLICVLILAAGCQTSVQPAQPITGGQTSIAYTPAEIAAAWTTPRNAGPSLVRKPKSGLAKFGLGAPLGLIENPSDPTFEHVGGGELDMKTSGPWKTLVVASSTYVLAGDVEGGGDGPSVWANGLRVSFQKPLDYFGKLGVNLSYTNRRYDWDGATAMFPGAIDPFENVHILRANVNLFQPISASWALVGSISGSMAAEDGADLTDGFSWGVTFGAGKRFSPTFDAGLGFLISDAFGESLFIIGGPQFTWKPTPQWQLSLQGTQLDLVYRPNPSWELGLAGGFQGARFRLRESGPGAGGIVGDTRVPAYLRIRYRGMSALDLEFRAGYDLWRYFTIEDRNGHAERSVDVDGGPFVDLRAILSL